MKLSILKSVIKKEINNVLKEFASYNNEELNILKKKFPEIKNISRIHLNWDRYVRILRYSPKTVFIKDGVETQDLKELRKDIDTAQKSLISILKKDKKEKILRKSIGDKFTYLPILNKDNKFAWTEINMEMSLNQITKVIRKLKDINKNNDYAKITTLFITS